MNWLKARSAKEILALVALLASIAGAGVLTIHRIWLIRILERNKLTEKIADVAVLDTLIIGLVLLSLGLAINKRTAKLTRQGVELSGGED